ncbi:hypothetical protein F383_01799 [Gossypium arboreum]|uniref:Uncharacterized protein n=1 Tax=Gossypium arboreum TaxID=29729 RepID=A0A0B0NVT1_GOSAR|nr:hypothetical protein F383_01799 [Gossypium arboreum]
MKTKRNLLQMDIEISRGPLPFFLLILTATFILKDASNLKKVSQLLSLAVSPRVIASHLKLEHPLLA